MSKVYDSIDDALERWISKQHVFFVGTAPLSADGHVNVSPKGDKGTFAVLDPHRVAYLDFAGSGAETIAHIHENGRIIIMFCAFEDRPRIVRLHGRGRVHQVGDRGFGELIDRFEHADVEPAAHRSIVEVDVNRIADSCGYSVPLMSFDGWRPHQDLWIDKKLSQDPGAIAHYIEDNNTSSLDGLPAIDPERLNSTPPTRP